MAGLNGRSIPPLILTTSFAGKRTENSAIRTSQRKIMPRNCIVPTLAKVSGYRTLPNSFIPATARIQDFLREVNSGFHQNDGRQAQASPSLLPGHLSENPQ